MPDWLVAEGSRYWMIYQSLPLITQWAVTLLIVAGIVVHIFAFNERAVHDAPSIFTTAGIFFTFFGIAEGLYDFNAQQIEASIPKLLEGLKTAFIASVFGVGIALSIKLRYSLVGARQSESSYVSDDATVFLPKYVAILNSKKYRDIVEEVRIEGHTSRLWGNPPIPPEQSYYKNMALSQERSRAVLVHVLSIPKIREAENWNWLVARLTANGLSGINPIKNPDGNINDALSQRVEFKVRTRSEARLDEMLKALAK